MPRTALILLVEARSSQGVSVCIESQF
jgi:hypothetical protein